MWFFGAVLEYCGKRNSNIGKKGVLNLVHGQDWVRIADVVMAFLLPNRRKSKIGLRPGKKLIRPKFCFPKYTVQVGARGHEFEACSAQLASHNVTCSNTKFSMHCAMWLQYFWNPLTGFFTFDCNYQCNSKNPVRGFRNNTDIQAAGTVMARRQDGGTPGAACNMLTLWWTQNGCQDV